MLMRRYAVVEKAKDADVIGILVGTLGVGQSCPSYVILVSPLMTDISSSISCISTSDHPFTRADCIASEKVVHCGCGETESGETGQLYGSRVFRSRGLSREHVDRFQGGLHASFILD